MTLEQKRAAKAYEHVAALAAQHKEGATEYGAFALKLPVLVRTAGLCQALHFLASRNKEMASALLGHLACQLERLDEEIKDEKSLLDRVRKAALPDYLRLSRESVAVAGWYARLAQSVLKVRPGEEVPS